jgi:hypothetical protein
MASRAHGLTNWLKAMVRAMVRFCQNISIVIVRRFVIDTHKDSETLGTEVKGQNLEAVGNEKWGIGDVVEHVEQEDGGDGGLGRGLVLECTEQRYGDGPHAEYNQHACIANEE